MIKNEKQLLIFCLLVSFISILIITILFLSSSISGLIFKSILLGDFLSIMNFTIGLLLIKLSEKKSEKIFLIVLWGGLLLRLILGLSLVIITLIFLEINTYGFIF